MNIRAKEYSNNAWCYKCKSSLKIDGTGYDTYIYPRCGPDAYNKDDLYEVVNHECSHCGAKTIRFYLKKGRKPKNMYDLGYKIAFKKHKRDHNPALSWRENIKYNPTRGWK
jgi:hypothetical protein